jgi:hypothetical protein
VRRFFALRVASREEGFSSAERGLSGGSINGAHLLLAADNGKGAVTTGVVECVLSEEKPRNVSRAKEELGARETYKLSVSIAQKEEVVACYLIANKLTSLGEALLR